MQMPWAEKLDPKRFGFLFVYSLWITLRKWVSKAKIELLRHYYRARHSNHVPSPPKATKPVAPGANP
jgi:hypothetical protein